MAGSASASVADLESLQAADAALVGHYTFTGATLSAALQDQAGLADHQAHAGDNGETVSLVSVLGSQALELPVPIDPENGAYTQRISQATPLGSGSAPLMLVGTFEAVILATTAGTGYDAIVGGYAQPAGNRFYFEQKGDGVQLRIGASAGNMAELISAAAFEVGVPYYIAVTWTYDDPTAAAGDATFTLNAWAADLVSAGPLTQTVTNAVYSAADGGVTNMSTAFGRNLASANNHWAGILDAVAFYVDDLPPATLAAHYAAALICTPCAELGTAVVDALCGDLPTTAAAFKAQLEQLIADYVDSGTCGGEAACEAELTSQLLGTAACTFLRDLLD